jgi:enoyl-CoA hydratase/carnithine racemase
MTKPDIFIERNGPLLALTLNRPDKRNALTLAMWDAIPDLVTPYADDPTLRLLIVRGAGGVFAAGADIAEFETVYATREAALANQARMQRAMSALEDFPIPTLALIEGACIGGGCGLALTCDLRYASPGARFGITPGKLGLAYGVSDTRRLVQAVGLSAAKDILFTGRLMDAEEALSLGLIDKLADEQKLDLAADALVDALTRASSYTARATKRILRLVRDGETTDTDESRDLFADAFDGPDFKEGFRAFLEKRPPRFP